MNTATRRALAPLTVAGALIFTGVSPASAQDLTLTFPVDSEIAACPGFTLQLEFDFADRAPKSLPTKDGLVRNITAGKGHLLTFTNLSTGESIEVTTGGSVQHKTINADGTETVKGTGQNLIILFPGDTPEGPSTILYTGQVTYTYIPGAGPLIPEFQSEEEKPRYDLNTSLTSKGKQRDICAELAS